MWLRASISLVLLVLGLIGSEWIVSVYGERLGREQRDEVSRQATEMRSRLESALNSTVFLAQGLAAYVVTVETPTEPQATRALRSLYESDTRIRNIALAPDNRIRFVYPLAGNEKALNLDYQSLPDQWPSVRKAIETRRSVLAGPVQLVQGGTGIINRTPVFLSGERFWGMISTVIDLPRLLADVEIAGQVEGVNYWLFGDNADERLESQIVGPAFAPAASSIEVGISVPGGHWRLMAMPVGGWQELPTEVAIMRAALYALSLLLAGFTYALIAGRSTAHELATQLGALNRDLVSTNLELHRLSRNDPLTRVPNRRSFEEAYAVAWSACVRQQLPISILMIDIDHFKSINDRYGHAAGDATLVEISAAIQAEVRRRDDLVARYGGEEFIVLLLGLSESEAAYMAENIRAAAGECRVQLPGEDTSAPNVTVSVGVATAVPKPEDHARDLIERADKALYAAKRGGRNRVCRESMLAA